MESSTDAEMLDWLLGEMDGRAVQFEKRYEWTLDGKRCLDYHLHYHLEESGRLVQKTVGYDLHTGLEAEPSKPPIGAGGTMREALVDAVANSKKKRAMVSDL